MSGWLQRFPLSVNGVPAAIVLLGVVFFSLALAEYVVPPVIVWLYHSGAIPGVPPRTRPLEHYLREWDRTVPWTALCSLLFFAFAWATSRPRFVRSQLASVRPADLGAIRVLVCTILLISSLWENLHSTARLPKALAQPMGVIQLLYALPIGFDAFVQHETALWLFEWFTPIVLFLGVIGWNTRVVVPLGFSAYLVLAGILRQYSYMYHTGMAPLYILGVLALTPCGDGASLDRLRRLARGLPVHSDEPSSVYGWSRLACWSVPVMAYLAAGLGKLRDGGLAWFDATNMKANLLADSLNTMQFSWGVSLKLVSAPDALFTLLGVASVALELSFGLVLFSPRARLILPFAMAGMHLGILVLQHILFFDLILMQIMFLDLSGWRRRIGRWIEHWANLPHPTWIIRRAARGSYKSLAFACVSTALLCWLGKIEFYPLSAWQMYNHPKLSGQISYFRVLAHYDSGSTERAPLESCSWSLAEDARYFRLIGYAFDDAHRVTLNRSLDECAAMLNAERLIGKRVTGFEIQRWEWNFRARPEDPRFGEMVDRYVYELRAADPARGVGGESLMDPNQRHGE